MKWRARILGIDAMNGHQDRSNAHFVVRTLVKTTRHQGFDAVCFPFEVGVAMPRKDGENIVAPETANKIVFVVYKSRAWPVTSDAVMHEHKNRRIRAKAPEVAIKPVQFCFIEMPPMLQSDRGIQQQEVDASVIERLIKLSERTRKIFLATGAPADVVIARNRVEADL